MIHWLEKHDKLIESIILLVIAILSGLYVNLLTNQMGLGESFFDAIKKVGGWNICVFFVFALVCFQRYVSNLCRVKIINFKDSIIEKILAAAALSLTYPNTNRHIRGIVTIYNPYDNKRYTRYQYNTGGDPEETVGAFPAEFGITGKAFVTKSVIVEELCDRHLDNEADDIKSSVLPEVKTILAAPIINPFKKEAKPIGVLAFDSVLPLSKLKVNTREAREIAQRWADIIGFILTSTEYDKVS